MSKILKDVLSKDKIVQRYIDNILLNKSLTLVDKIVRHLDTLG